ncbi:MAG: archaeal heat shock protein Hsp20 [Candidatus Njordarchaeia archaeon]|nr:Hsp20/alpha crystallin family protein [Candidatus Korarchaeota archaeon]
MSDDDRKKRKRDEWEDPFERFMREFFGRRSPFDEIFRSFRETIKRMMEEMDEMGFSFPREPLFKEFPKYGKSYVYGFTMTIGPDGRPIIKEFGNVPPRRGIIREKTEEGKELWEPISTVYQEDDKIKIVVDLPGAKKDTIKINASETEVEVRAESDMRKYYKRIRLQEKVDPNSAKAKYNNGVLEIEFETKEKKEKKKEIPVE